MQAITDQPEANVPRLLTVREAAEFLGCSEANIYSLIKAGVVPYVMIGRRKGYRLDRVDLGLFIESQKQQKAAAPARLPRQKLKHIRLSGN